ncbi:MAG: DUF1818 family protein [Cyanobacteria bacterium J06621_8]
MSRRIKAGDGWRIGWCSQDSKYQGLVGANDWAIELTSEEFADFQRLLNQLVATMKAMEAELMESEKISCEAESELVWLEATGYPYHYTIRLILNGDRRCEGNWAAEAVPEFIAAINSLEVS